MKKFLFSFIAILCASVMNGQTVTEYFDAGNPIKIDGTEFYLGWSSNPATGYFVQEYFPMGEAPEHYNRMLTVSPLKFNQTTAVAAQAKVQELEERKEKDKVCNYQMLERNGECIVDFVVSDISSGELTTVEWNIHYYKQIKIGKQNYLLLTFLSQRAYGDDIIPFLKSIPDKRAKTTIALTEKKLKIKKLK